MYPRNYAQYTLLERLATGGMSEVDLARRAVDDTAYVRFLVVKRIRANRVDDDAFVRMFKDEARITSELRHTNIAQVYDFGRVDDEYYLALEYVPGTDLRMVLNALRAQRKRMPVRQALRFTADVLSALHYAHTRTDNRGRPMQIIHRDVNPRNIMVSLTGEVKLIDFGVARATDRLERTQTDHFKGKVAYMAPEQVKGDSLDHRVDLFALGLTLYEMLTGKSAFAGLDQTQILYRILQGDLPALDVPREWGEAGRTLSDVVAKSLAPDPDERFADAEAMRLAIVDVAGAFGGLPTPVELGDFIHELDPDLRARIHAKMAEWSGELDGVGVPAESGAFSFSPAPTEEGTAPTQQMPMPQPVASAVEPPDSLDSTTSATAPVVLMAGLGTAGVVLLGLAGVLLVGGVVLWWVLSTGPAQVAATDHTDTLVQVVEEEPKEVVPLKIWPPPRPIEDGPGTTGRRPGAGTTAVADSTPPQTPEPTPGDEPATGTDEPADPTAAPDPQPPAVAEPVVVTPKVPDPEPSDPGPVDMGELQVTAAEKGLPLTINGRSTRFVTGQKFDWPAGRHTIAAPGLAPRTVSVRANMVAFVPLKPE
ncbi:MAG: protein kinase [Myxococcota bacterium]